MIHYLRFLRPDHDQDSSVIRLTTDNFCSQSTACGRLLLIVSVLRSFAVNFRR